MVSCKPSRVAALVATAVLAAVLTAGPASAQAPTADIYVPPGIGVDTWIGEQTLPVAVNVVNFGDAAAADVAVTLEVPPGWTADVPADADPPERSCTAATDGTSVTCTFDQLEPGGSYRSYFAEVTSPAGPSTPGIATVTATTSTPEVDEFPNTASDTLRHIGVYHPEVVVTPSTGIVDGAQAQVQVTDFAPSATFGSAMCEDTLPLALADCDLATLTTWSSDAAGSATFTRPMSRFIVTDSGILDCAVDSCRLGVGTLDLTTVGSAVVSFAPGPQPGSEIGVELDAQPYLSQDPTGPATVPAVLTCTAAATVRVQFTLSQATVGGARNTRTSTIVGIPCSPGSPVPISSDLTGDSFGPGPADVVVRATAGLSAATVAGDVEVRSSAQAFADLAARFADPSDTTVLAEFVAAFTFRLQYNPVFSRAFWQAVLAPPAP